MARQIRLIKPLIAGLISLSAILLCWLISPAFSTSGQQADIFNQVWQTVNDNFYDPNFNGVDWRAMQQKYKPLVAQAESSEMAAALINQMLAELKTSHTYLYTSDQPAYYQVLGIFAPRDAELQKQLKPFLPLGKIEYVGIGISTREIDHKTFINAILEGSPAAQAKLQVGDQILSVEGLPFHPIQSFVGKAGQAVALLIQRSPDPNTQQEIAVTPKLLDATTMFFDAQSASVQVIEQQGKKIGYIHIWSCGSEQYQQLLEQELLDGRLREIDGFILDLREGWGGTPGTVLNFFTGRSPSITSVTRDGNRYVSSSDWNKPMSVLVNENSRSAKEILAYGFQQYKIGVIVGTKTAGAVVAGRPFLMQDGSFLYVAVSDVYVDGEKRLEGVGITPDVVVPFTLAYTQGSDPQKEQAIAVTLQAIQQREPS